MSNSKRLHPLLNKDAKHYDNGDEPTIKMLERKMTVREMIGACVFNEGKYEARMKGQDAEDKKKAEDYRAYRHSLQLIPRAYENTLVVNAYSACHISWNYAI